MGIFDRTPPDPFAQEVKDLAEEFRALQAADSDRLSRMATYRAELEAARDNRVDIGTETRDYGRQLARQSDLQRHSFNLPFGQALTVKHSFRIAGRLPDAQVDRREETPEERHRSDVMEKIWWGALRESKGDVVFASAAHDGSQLGASCLEIYFDAKRQMPLFRDVDPLGVLVVKGVNDPHDFQRVYRFWEVPASTLVAEYRNAPDVNVQAITSGPNGKVCVVQMTDKQRTVRFALGYSKDGSKGEDVPLFQDTHGYGFVNYVVIPNLGPYRNVWGWSDYEFVRELIAYIGKEFGREADILRMVANGAMQVTGTKLTPAAIRKILQTGGVVPTGKDGKVAPIEAPQVPSFAESHADRSMQFLHMLGFAPAAAWGDGDAGSGSDRGLQLGPMLELTSMKQINFGAGLARLGSMMFQMIDTVQAAPAKYRGVASRGSRKSPFRMVFGPSASPVTRQVRDEFGDVQDVEMPMTPDELFDNDFEIRFSWPTRLDPDDPAFVNSELAKFQQGTQSLRTTLEKFGVEAPEDEIRLIEQENEDHPWLRQGFIKLLEMQMNATQQGANDGSQNQQGGDFASAAGTMANTTATDAEAMQSTLPGGLPGVLNGQA